MNPADIYTKINNNLHVSRTELEEAIVFFGNLHDQLKQCGLVFHLAAQEALKTRYNLEVQKKSRELRYKEITWLKQVR